MDASKNYIEKLNNHNYDSWSFKVRMMLVREDSWGLISQDCPVPVVSQAGVTTNQAEIEAWKLKDGKAFALIALTVDDMQLQLIRNDTTSKAAWKSLKDYHQKSTVATKVSLLKKLCKMELKDGGDMEAHLFKMDELFERLTNAGKSLEEDLRVAFVLASLPEKYNTLTTALEAREEKDLTLALIKSKLLDEYKKNCAEIETSDKALKIVSHGKPVKSKFSCNYCKKPGHVKKNCFKWKGDQNKNQEKDRNSNQANVVRKIDQDPSDMHKTSFCFANFEKRFVKNWFVDSGATNHMTADSRFFSTIEQHNSPIHLADGNLIKAVGIGNGNFNAVDDKGNPINIEIRDVLYVPELSGSLVSVKQLTQKGLKVIFDENMCRIMEGKNTIAVARLNDSNLYQLIESDTAGVANNFQHNENCIHTWHKRLGHREVNAIQQMCDQNLAHGIEMKSCGIKEVCECCLKGKMCRRPFPESKSNTKDILELVHSDVCTMEVETPSGHKYFVTFIDDFSKYTRVFLMKQKSETFNKFKIYVAETQNQFNRKLKKLRSDNGGEYISVEFKKFCQEQGIECQYTVAYSPQQNGIVERKNRYLTEMTRCLLIESKLEKKYWGEALVTANYIQNRCSSRSVKSTPYEKWYNTKPDLSNLRIFGTHAFVHIPKEKRLKLDEKSRELIFVGYSENSKGWRFLDRSNDTVVISRDVKFIELNNGSNAFKKTLSPDIIEISLDYSNQDVPVNEDQMNENESDRDIEEASIRSEFDYEDDQDFFDTTANSLPEIQIQEEIPQSSRRSCRQNKGKLPEKYNDCEMNLDDLVLLCSRTSLTFKDIDSSDDKQLWLQAMKEEIDSLKENNTWELVKLPENRQAIGNKWVFTIKEDNEGKSRYKARLVAMG